MFSLYFMEYFDNLMDVFSLEDDDAAGLFITQSSPSHVSNVITGNPSDFSSPCVSLISQSSGVELQYSDISDDDAFKIPCSQSSKSDTRYVYIV